MSACFQSDIPTNPYNCILLHQAIRQLLGLSIADVSGCTALSEAALCTTGRFTATQPPAAGPQWHPPSVLTTKNVLRCCWMLPGVKITPGGNCCLTRLLLSLCRENKAKRFYLVVKMLSSPGFWSHYQKCFLYQQPCASSPQGRDAQDILGCTSPPS